MSFGEGDLHAKCDMLEAENRELQSKNDRLAETNGALCAEINRQARVIEKLKREWTGTIKLIKSGPRYDVWLYTCCGYEHAESVSEEYVVANYCPNCGARMVDE